MNEELRKAIRALSEAAFQTGRWRLSPIAPTDADINAAEAAVVAIFERDRAVAKQLAEALVKVRTDGFCPDCANLQDGTDRGGKCSDECAAMLQTVLTALAAYAALEAKR
jgi:hypothetical protein